MSYLHVLNRYNEISAGIGVLRLIIAASEPLAAVSIHVVAYTIPGAYYIRYLLNKYSEVANGW
jgi:hypothetical protein